jgi:tight adherence protein B
VGAALGVLLGIGLVLIWTGCGPRDRAEAGFLRRWSSRRTDLLWQAGLERVSAWHLLFAQVGVAVLAALVTLVITGSASVACCFLVFGGAAPVALVRRLRRSRAADLREVWPDVVDNLSSAVRAGLSLPEALGALGERGPVPLRPAFIAFGSDYRASGRFSDALSRLKERLADPVGDRVCETLRLAREVGGSDLGVVLRTLSGFLREDARVRGELEARQSWTVNAARLAAAAPWLVLLLLSTQTTSLESYDSAGGVLLLGLGAAVCVVAYLLMIRIGRLPEEPRVLR